MAGLVTIILGGLLASCHATTRVNRHFNGDIFVDPGTTRRGEGRAIIEVGVYEDNIQI